jgi:hypothetical protein
MKFATSGEGLAMFVIRHSASGESRALQAHEALQELGEILFPSEAVRVLSIYKPKHPWFGQEHVYVAIEQDDNLTR